MSRLVTTAAAAFRETLTDLGLADEESDIGDPTELGRRAALLVASDLVWRRQIGPLLDGPQVRQLLGVRTRQAVHDLVKRGRLLGLPSRDGSTVFPAFQFSAEGRPLPALPAILATFSGAVESPYTIASWFVSPQPLLDGDTPAAWLREGRDPEVASEAARRAAARLAQ